MSTMIDVLSDKDFLVRLDKEKIKNTYTKIVVLDREERPVDEIQGRTTGGSLNVDGKSSSRRSCSVSLIVDDTVNSDLNDLDNLFSLNKRIKVFIGIKNDIVRQQYPELTDSIIWFPQGVYLIAGVSLQHGLNNISISLSLKDKMSLLNGELGGVFPAAVTLSHERNKLENGEEEIVDHYIYDIIKTVVHWYGAEDNARIIINDLDRYIKQVAYADDYFYIYRDKDNRITSATYNRNMTCLEGDSVDYTFTHIKVNEKDKKTNQPSDITMIFKGQDGMTKYADGCLYTANPLAMVEKEVFRFKNGKEISLSYLNRRNGDHWVHYNEDIYPISAAMVKEYGPNYTRYEDVIDGGKWEYYEPGAEIGYRYIDFYWTGEDLIANPGEAVTSILDKIVNRLGNYEYFYDINGNFIFQEKKNFLNNRLLEIDDAYLLGNFNRETNVRYPENEVCGINNNNYMADFDGNFDKVYDFVGNEVTTITSYSNNFNYSAIKNDFHLWGKSNTDMNFNDVHYHLAVREKPKAPYNSYKSILVRDMISNKKTGRKGDGSEIDDIRLFNPDIYKLNCIGRRETDLDDLDVKKTKVWIRVKENLTGDYLYKYISDDQLYYKASSQTREKVPRSAWHSKPSEEEIAANTYPVPHWEEGYKDKWYCICVEPKGNDNVFSPVGLIKPRITDNEEGDNFLLQLDSCIWDGTLFGGDSGVAWMKRPEYISYHDSRVDESGTILMLNNTINNNRCYSGYEYAVYKRNDVNILDMDAYWGMEEDSGILKHMYGVWFKDIVDYVPIDWRMELYMQCLAKLQRGETPDVYEMEIKDNFLDIYSVRKKKFKADFIHNPNKLKYFIDYVSIENKNDVSTENVGIKTQVQVFDGERKIFKLDVPDVVYFIDDDNSNNEINRYKEICENTGEHILIVDKDTYSIIGKRYSGASFVELARNMLYQGTEFIDTINIQTLPIYYLEPNTRISVDDISTNIHGDYIIDTITPPLNGSGTMSITATKAVTKY